MNAKLTKKQAIAKIAELLNKLNIATPFDLSVSRYGYVCHLGENGQYQSFYGKSWDEVIKKIIETVTRK